MYIEKITSLLNKASDDNKKIIANNLNAIFDYPSVVCHHNVATTMASARLEGEDLIQRLEELNRQRNKAHDNVCVAICNINQISKWYEGRHIFDFTLEPINRENCFIGYSQHNHAVATEICADIINDYYYCGKEPKAQYMLDEFAKEEKVKHIEPKSVDELLSELNNYKKITIAENDVEAKISENDYIVLRNGIKLKILSKNNFSMNLKICTQNIKQIAKENSFYFDKDKIAIDIPISVVKEIIQDNGGIRKENNLER